MDQTERNRRALAVFDEVCDLAGPAREAALTRLCADDTALRERVERLLAEDEQQGGPIGATSFGGGAGVLAGGLAIEDELPECIGPYRVLRELGRGGMGVVYEAEQDHPRRRVALKVIRQGLGSRDALRRFEREVAVLARLDHPGVAQVYSAGSARVGGAALPYFAMELVDGLPLDRHVAEHGLGRRDVLELMARVCDAVHHAHQREVVHRDLKPANILVRAGETISGTRTHTGTTLDGIGLPKILDFGVARATEAGPGATLHTQAGQIIGTLAYMSPEQLGGEPGSVDTRTDVYAIGVMLYELLTGRRPHDLGGLHVAEAARRLREESPPRLGQIDSSLRGDLETIVAKAIEQDPDRRYASAAALGEDIRRLLRDEPITARPATAMYQFRKFARRNRALVGGVAATFLVLVAGLVAVSVLLVVVSDQRDEAIALKDAADEALERERAVASFQSSMLSGVDLAESGERVWQQIRDRLVRAAAAQNPGEVERETADIDRVLGRLSGPDVVRFVIGDAVLERSEERLRESADVFGADSRRSLFTGLGIAYKALGMEEAALRNFRSALDAAEEPGGSTPAGYLQLRGRLALLLSDMHRDAEALEHIRFVRDRSIESGGIAGPRSVQFSRIMINTLAHEGRFREAIAEFERLLEELRAVEPPVPGLIAGSTLGLSRELVAAGDPWAALPKIEWATADITARVGKPTTNVPDKLGYVYNALERFDEAHEQYARLIEVCRERRGDEHEWTLDAQRKLAGSLIDAGEFERGRALLEEVLEIQRRILPEGDLAIAHTQRLLVEPLLEAGRVEEARVHADEAVAVAEATFGEGAFRSFSARLALTRALLAGGDAAAALEEVSPVRETCHECAGPSSPVSLEADVLFGRALCALGRWDEAEAVVRSAIEHHWMPGRRRAEAELVLAQALVGRGEIEKARDYLEERVERWGGEPRMTDRRARAEALLESLATSD